MPINKLNPCEMLLRAFFVSCTNSFSPSWIPFQPSQSVGDESFGLDRFLPAFTEPDLRYWLLKYRCSLLVVGLAFSRAEPAEGSDLRDRFLAALAPQTQPSAEQ